MFQDKAEAHVSASRTAQPIQFTPFSCPLVVERLREKLTTGQIVHSVAGMVAALDGVATVN